MELYPNTNILAEPKLGKRGLYPTLSQKGNHNSVQIRMGLISQADGDTNIFKISQLLKKPLKLICNEYKLLKTKKILK